MGVPPQVLAMLQQQGGPPGATGGPQTPPQGLGGPPGVQGGDNEHAAVSFLKQAMQALRNYEQAESDPEDKAAAAKVYALLTQILAKDQKEADAATGASPAVKYLRNASAGGPVAS